ncbi:MAG: type II toxin-antitoxin system RelB/DinJ family antitoxin [Lachnospirales bacterium]
MKTINIKVDDDTKIKSEKIFKELGLSTSSAINIFLKKVINCNGIPFELKLNNDVYSKDEIFTLFEEFKKGNVKTIEKTFEELEEMENGEN